MDNLGSYVVPTCPGPGLSYPSLQPSFRNQMGCLGFRPCLDSYVTPAAKTNLFGEKWREERRGSEALNDQFT